MGNFSKLKHKTSLSNGFEIILNTVNPEKLNLHENPKNAVKLLTSHLEDLYWPFKILSSVVNMMHSLKVQTLWNAKMITSQVRMAPLKSIRYVFVPNFN